MLASVVGPIATASAADPITTQSSPSLTAPADDPTTAIKDVVLKWTAVTYATSYQVQLSPNGDFTNNVVTLPNSGKTPGTQYELPLSVPHDEYFWRVRALDSKAATAWSSTRSFLKDWVNGLDILQPPTGTDPTIVWAPDPEASIYRVRISTDPGFPSDPKKTGVCWTANTSWTPYTLSSTTETVNGNCMNTNDMLDGMTYYYEVSAWDDSTAALVTSDNAPDANWDCAIAEPECDAMTLGSLGSFVFSAPAPGSPTGVPTGLTTTWHTTSLPGNSCTAGTCPVTPMMSWTPVAGANYYRVFVSHDPYFTNIYRVYDTQWPSVTARDVFLDAQSGHGYYWSVEAGTCVNETNSLCGTPVLVGDNTPPSGGKTTITLGSSSTTAMFGKSSGTVPLTGPANGAFLTSPGVTFNWDSYLDNGGQNATDARNYRVQVATDPDFSNVLFDVSDVDMTQWTNSSAVLGDGLYYWRVQPIDESGNHLRWSSIRHFSKDSTPPVFTLTDRSPAAVSSALHVKVDDPALVGTVSQSTLHVIPVVGSSTAVPGVWTKTSVTTWTFRPSNRLTPGQTYALAVVGSLTDQAGNQAIASNRSVRTSGRVDDTNPAWHYGSGWRKVSASGALGGFFHRGVAGATATVQVVGKTLSVYACKAPRSGRLRIQVDGSFKAAPSLRQSFTKCGVLVYRGDVTTNRVHTVRTTAVRGPVDLDMVRIS